MRISDWSSDVCSSDLISLAIGDSSETGGSDPAGELIHRLVSARDSAETANAAAGRSRVALYRALSLAYDFYLVAVQHPAAYAALLDGAGLAVQARAPMTPVVKLVFGIHYDKTRLTEFSAVLSYAARNGVNADRKSTRLNSSHSCASRMPSSA